MHSILGIYLSITLFIAISNSTELPSKLADDNLPEAYTVEGLNGSNLELEPFYCEIDGLPLEDLERVAKNDNISSNVSITVNVRRNDVHPVETFKPNNYVLEVVNDTLVVTGEIIRKKSEKNVSATTGNDTTVGPYSFDCSIKILDPNLKVSDIETSVEKTPPKILNDYNHIVLMNGAPDQLVSCIVEGSPIPDVKWVNVNRDHDESQGQSILRTLSSDDSGLSRRTSYLLFSKVVLQTSGNYTCVAENDVGSTNKTFEVKVIAVESVNSRCNTIQEFNPTPTYSTTVLESDGSLLHNEDEILTRLRRHLWYQWRGTSGTKYFIPPPPSPRPRPNGDDLSTTQSAEDPLYTDLQRMVNFITARLKLADKVAVNKWDNNSPVEDRPREQIILDNMVRQAENRGLSSSWATQFFRDQIEANKDIQNERIRMWNYQGGRPSGPPVDLANDIRPQIDTINGKLIEYAKRTEYEREEWKCRPEVEKNARYSTFLYKLDPIHQRALQRATQNLCIAPKPPRPTFGW